MDYISYAIHNNKLTKGLYEDNRELYKICELRTVMDNLINGFYINNSPTPTEEGTEFIFARIFTDKQLMKGLDYAEGVADELNKILEVSNFTIKDFIKNESEELYKRLYGNE